MFSRANRLQLMVRKLSEHGENFQTQFLTGYYAWLSHEKNYSL